MTASTPGVARPDRKPRYRVRITEWNRDGVRGAQGPGAEYSLTLLPEYCGLVAGWGGAYRRLPSVTTLALVYRK